MLLVATFCVGALGRDGFRRALCDRTGADPGALGPSARRHRDGRRGRHVWLGDRGAGDDGSLLGTAPLGNMVFVTRALLAVVLGFVVLGIIGDLRPAGRRTAARLADLPATPGGVLSSDEIDLATDAARIFVDEIAPGGQRARRAAGIERSRIAVELHADVHHRSCGGRCAKPSRAAHRNDWWSPCGTCLPRSMDSHSIEARSRSMSSDCCRPSSGSPSRDRGALGRAD